jgi:D-glycero-D-manno-heptose 1,7-bisphosphate phosphatase
MNRAAFLDRDGTLIVDVNYLSDLAQLQLIPGVVDLLLQLQAAGYLLIVVTNQSGIARGYFDESFVRRTHEKLDLLLREQGVAITAWYFCPHHPDAAALAEHKQACVCRKPRPGMLYQAARNHDIDLAASLMIGDTQRDLDAGAAANCRTYLINQALAGQIEEL